MTDRRDDIDQPPIDPSRGGPRHGVRGDAGEPLAHYASGAEWDPYAREPTTPEQERMATASQWRIMWVKFRRHKLAVICGAILAFMYVSILFVEQIAPYDQQSRNTDYIHAPPQMIHFFHEGEFVGPFVYGLTPSLPDDPRARLEALSRDPAAGLTRNYETDTSVIHPVRFFCFGDEYEWFGMVPGSFHLFCPAEGGTLFLFGTDRLGRDIFSQVVYGARISLTVGLIGISISFVLGIVIGGIAGYYGGIIDNVVNRIIEIFQSFPQIPLWMALAAAIPADVSPITRYIGITVILGLVDWTGLARAVRSKLLSLREEDFTTAAQLMGASPPRIIGRHLLPSFMSHLIASATISIPGMILAETALSYLGLGLREPIISWGVLLNNAQNINAVTIYPWLMIPVIPVIIVVLCFQFFGDGLRDAADPYK